MRDTDTDLMFETPRRERPRGQGGPDLSGDLLRDAVAACLDELWAEVLAPRLGALIEGRLAGHLKQRDEPRRALTIDEACESYGFSRSTWDREWAQRKQNGLEEVVVRLGSRLYLPLPEFDDWFRRMRGPRLAPLRSS